MKKFTLAAVIMLSLGFFAKAQEQPVKKRQFFNLADPKILTDLGVTAEQKTELRQAIDADGKPNPWYRKSLVPFDAKVIEELTITPEQKQKFTTIQRDYNNERRKVGDISAKVTADSILEQENMLNDAQKKKMAEMKAAIIEYNNSIK